MSVEIIWDKLRAKGFSEKATAAIMGNMMAESGLIPYRIQGDFGNGYQRSLEYTAKVDKGEISREQFAYNGPGGGGYGLCQWTYFSRKLGLYDLAKKRDVSIGNQQLGIDWFYEEVQQGEYRRTWEALKSDSSIYDMVKVMLRNFEKPADQTESAVAQRTAMANQIYERCKGHPTEQAPAPPSHGGSADSCDITVRVLRKGDLGRDVFLLQTGLQDMGIDCGIPDGDFGDNTEMAVNELKETVGLPMDGVADADVWQIVFQ